MVMCVTVFWRYSTPYHECSLWACIKCLTGLMSTISVSDLDSFEDTCLLVVRYDNDDPGTKPTAMKVFNEGGVGISPEDRDPLDE